MRSQSQQHGQVLTISSPKVSSSSPESNTGGGGDSIDSGSSERSPRLGVGALSRPRIHHESCPSRKGSPSFRSKGDLPRKPLELRSLQESLLFGRGFVDRRSPHKSLFVFGLPPKTLRLFALRLRPQGVQTTGLRRVRKDRMHALHASPRHRGAVRRVRDRKLLRGLPGRIRIRNGRLLMKRKTNGTKGGERKIEGDNA